jgi:hypothetical protein
MTWNTNNAGKICFDCIQIHILFLKSNQLLQPHFTAAMELLLHVQSLAHLWRPWSISQLCDPVCMFCYNREKLLVAAFHVWKLQIQSIFTFCNSTLPVLIDICSSQLTHEEKGLSLWFSMSFSIHPYKCICILSIPERKSRRYAESFLMCFTLPVQDAVLMPYISRIWLSAKFKACFI